MEGFKHGAIDAEVANAPKSSGTAEVKEFMPVPRLRAEKVPCQIKLAGQILKMHRDRRLAHCSLITKILADREAWLHGLHALWRGGLSRRPITFAFNGDPGSASIWLQMGALGPRRGVVNDGHYAPPRIVENAYSILDATDLAMIDPVGTGFSRPVGEAKGKNFWGVDQNIESGRYTA